MRQNFCTSTRLEHPDMDNVAYNAAPGKSIARALECQAEEINRKNNDIKALKGGARRTTTPLYQCVVWRACG